MIIYPATTAFRNTQMAFEIDDNDPDFVRDPTGLYAIYYGVEPVLLLQATETYGHWDVIAKVRAVHLEKIRYIIGETLNGYTRTAG